MKKFLILFFILYNFTVLAQQPIDLKLNLIKNQCFTITKINKSEGTVFFQGEEKPKYMSDKDVYECSVLEAGKKGFTIKITYTDFFHEIKYLHMDTKMSPELVDEHNIYNPSTLLALKLNHSFTVLLSDKGKVLKIKQLKKYIADIQKKVNTVLNKEMREIYLKSIPADKDIIQAIELVTNFYPNNPVNVGEQWTNHKANFTLKQITDTTYIIESESNYQSDTSDKKELSGMLIYINETVRQTAIITIEKQTGLPYSYSVIEEKEGYTVVENKEGQELMRMSHSDNLTRDTFIKLK